MKKKFALMLVSLMLFAVMLVGCGQSTGEAPASTTETSSASSATVPSRVESSQPASFAEEGPGNAVSSDSPDISAPDTATTVPASSELQPTASASYPLSGMDLHVRFGDDGAPFALHLYDNETAAAIARHVGTADWRLPIYNYEGYDHWEVMQYYDIPSRYEIPSNPENVTSERAGTVFYSEPNRIVLFFGDAEVSSEYTPVGYIDYSQDFVSAVENNPVLEGWGNKIVQISD